MKFRPDPALTAALRGVVAEGRIEVRVGPGARSEAVRIEGSTVHLRVTAPPANGAANTAALRLLASAMDVPPRNLTLLRGATGRVKLIGIRFD